MCSLPVILLHLAIIFLNLVTGAFVTNSTLPKCCDINEQVIAKDQKLECVANEKRRLQIISEINNFLSANSEGECIDSDGVDFFNYKFNNSTIISKTKLEERYYPKCCPLGMKYDPTERSCVTSFNQNKDWIGNTLIKVGLPNCRLIVDKIVSNHSDFLNETLNKDENSYCIDQIIEENNFVIRECKDITLCQKKRCIKKCCADGQSFVGGGMCVDTYTRSLNIQNASFTKYIEDPDDDFQVLYSSKCPSVHLLRQNFISYTIRKNGTWIYWSNYSGKFVEELYDHNRSYCIEHAKKGNMSEYLVFECINKNSTVAPKFVLTFWSKILSCIALIATVVLYFVMGEVKNSFGKILVNYCTAMFCLMVVLLHALVKNSIVTPTECKIRGYLLIFLNTALYIWLNIMSWDIWWTFGSPKRIICNDQRWKDIKKMLLYMLYGWGFPICHCLVIFLFDLIRILPDQIQPYIGPYFCFMEARNYAKHFFILTPLLIVQIVNIVLFIKTTAYCINVKKEISKMNDTAKGTKETSKFMQNKDRLGLIVKLAVIMGVLFIYELATSCFDLKTTQLQYLEVFMDNIMCLQGVFFFIIFICKKKTLNFFHRRYLAKERRTSCSTSFTSQLHNNTMTGSLHTNSSIQLKNGKS